MTRSILVFGAGGQVGQELLKLATAEAIRATGAARSDADVTNLDAVLQLARAVKPQMIVNAAAYTAVDKAESEASAAYAVNAQGAENVALAATEVGAELLHISTDYIFDGQKAGPYIESDPIAPLGVYGASKADGESRVCSVTSNAVILRTAWVYGPYGNNFLKTMLRLAMTEPKLRVVADQYGSPTATIDIARAILAVANSATIPGGIFHFAGTGATSWHGFAEMIVEAQATFSGKHIPVEAITTEQYPTAARRPANSVFRSDRFAQAFGYRSHPWQQRTRETIETLLKINCGAHTSGALP